MSSARLIVTSRYLKSGSAGGSVKRRNYTKYIATRETVELREQKELLNSSSKQTTDKQRKLLTELLSDFPEAKDYLEYQDYTASPTQQNASELIGTIIERNADLIGNKKNLVSYMAMRPGAEKRGQHGLFNGSDKPIVLNQAAEEVAHHKGNVWSHVVSLRREDAVRLGYDNSDRWRELVKRHIADIAEAHKIPLSHLKWYAAFHNTAHHPHIHLLIYSANPKEGFLTRQGIDKIRSVLANDIFHDELQSIYQGQTETRNQIKVLSAEEFSEMVSRMQECHFQNPKLESLVFRLREQLKKTKGKKVYGYLPKEVKQTVDEIFTVLAGDEQIKSLYTQWCKLEKLKYQSYTMHEPNLPELQNNKSFKSVKNMIIRIVLKMDSPLNLPEPEVRYHSPASKEYWKAMHFLSSDDADKGLKMLADLAEKGDTDAAYQLGKIYSEGVLVYQDLEKAEKYLRQAVAVGNPHAQYAMARLFMTEEKRDLSKAMELLKQCADKNPWAAFRLGKLLLFGSDEILSDREAAKFWLNKAAENGITIAGELAENTEQFEKKMASEAVAGLFIGLSRIFDEDYLDKAKKLSQADSKLKAMLSRKKRELGIKEESTQEQSY